MEIKANPSLLCIDFHLKAFCTLGTIGMELW